MHRQLSLNSLLSSIKQMLGPNLPAPVSSSVNVAIIPEFKGAVSFRFQRTDECCCSFAHSADIHCVLTRTLF